MLSRRIPNKPSGGTFREVSILPYMGTERDPGNGTPEKPLKTTMSLALRINLSEDPYDRRLFIPVSLRLIRPTRHLLGTLINCE